MQQLSKKPQLNELLLQLLAFGVLHLLVGSV